MSLISNSSRVSILYTYIKLYYFEIIFFIFYYVSLFPGRISTDAEVSILLMDLNKSASNWTELYFRFLQLISIDGNTIAFASAFGLILLAVSLKYFINSIANELKYRKNIFRFLCVFPIMPIFGLTVQHDVFACSGTLLITGILLRVGRGHYFASKKNFALIFVSIFFACMSFIGIIAVAGMLFGFAVHKKKKYTLATVLIMALIQFLSIFLSVAPRDPGFKLIPFLGDLKCIAQDTDSIISNGQWKFLEQLGPRESWVAQSSCISADNAGFAIKEAGEVPLKDFIKGWYEVVSQNPRVLLSARVQRSSMALPPLFSSGQPNSREVNFLIPVGLNSNRSLRVGPEVIQDAPLAGKFSNQQIPIIKNLERPVLSAAFLINMNSRLWGWGGFWSVWFIFLLFIHGNKSLSGIYPMLFQFFFLIALSPVPDPRYVFSWILIGISSFGLLALYVHDILKLKSGKN